MQANQKDLMDGACQQPLTRSLGPSVSICQLNIEGISQAKCTHLSRLLRQNNVDIVLIQETHTTSEYQLRTRGCIDGYEPVGATYHPHYGIATYARSNIENVHLVHSCSDHDISVITIDLNGTKITNVYKPPNVGWPTDTLKSFEHPALYIGDFNSHHTQWNYKNNDDNGDSLVEWAEFHNMNLVFDAKQPGTFGPPGGRTIIILIYVL